MRHWMDLLEAKHTPPKNEVGDAAHHSAMANTGFFGETGAGSLFMAKTTGRVMLVHRSRAVVEPNTWAGVGGACNANERPLDTAIREMHEETGYDGTPQMVPLFVFASGSFRYSNFLAIVEDEFNPSLGWEADNYVWVEIGKWPSPLHFGLEALFKDKKSTDVIKHYATLFGDHQNG